MTLDPKICIMLDVMFESTPDEAHKRAEWVSAWELIESLARDATRWHETCGDDCGIESLTEWRSRVLNQLQAALQQEQQAFDSLRQLR